MKNSQEVENLILLVMSPNDIPARTAILGKVLGKATALPAGGLLCGAVAVMIGNIPDKLWDEIVTIEVPPCGNEGCNCHVLQQAFLRSLIPVRELYKKAGKEVDDEQGKGFSA